MQALCRLRPPGCPPSTATGGDEALPRRVSELGDQCSKSSSAGFSICRRLRAEPARRATPRAVLDRAGTSTASTSSCPDEPDRRIVHDVIYDKLCVGVVDDRSRDEYRRIMDDLAARGAEGILLGCTEIDLLVGPGDAPVPIFDTTRLHAERAVALALDDVAGPATTARVTSPPRRSGGVPSRPAQQPER